MNTVPDGKKPSSKIKYALLLALCVFSSSVLAEYYVVYASPAVFVEEPPSPCMVCQSRYHHHYYKKQRCHHRYIRHHCYQKRACDISIYYGVPRGGLCGGATMWVPGPTVVMPPSVVRYGTPVFRPDTYHSMREVSMDLRTGDDIYF